MRPKEKEIIMRALKTTVVMTGLVVLMGCSSSLKQPEPYIKQSKVCTDRWYGYHKESGCPSTAKAVTPDPSKEAPVLLAAAQASGAERERLAAELTAANQRVADLESQLADRDKELSGLRGELSEEMAKLKQAERGLIRALKPQIEEKNITVDLNNERLLMNLASGYLFGSGEDQLKPAGADALKQIGSILKDFPEYKVHVEGHTDNRPILGALKQKFPSNKELSEARARNAVEALASGGLSGAHAMGAADTKPVMPNTTAVGRASNRRVDIIVTR